MNRFSYDETIKFRKFKPLTPAAEEVRKWH